MEPIFLIVDLFCGFGGTTTGFLDAESNGNKIVKVIACVNHDPKAIKSHWLNHPEVKHFEEDIRTLDLTELTNIVNYWKGIYPNAYVILWASLECTNFSKAKGGQARDADSRTLAEHLPRYQVALNPDYIQIENVVEFMSWGPLDENGKPISRKNGQDYMKWRNQMCSNIYHDDWKELNSADFGAYTSRNRLFGCFAKHGLPIVWPETTHAKKPATIGMFGIQKKWNAVKEVLNFKDEGLSIFNRKKQLSDKTFERIYAGLLKYIAKGDKSFIQKYYSGRPAGKVISVDGPAGTITTACGQTLIQPEFLLKYNSINGKTGVHHPPSIQEPAPTIACQARLGLVQPQFLMASNGGIPSAKVFSVENPCRVITTSDNKSLVQPEFLASYYGNGHNLTSIESPAPTIPTKDRISLIQPEYFIDKHFGPIGSQSIEQPAGTIMINDKHRLVEVEPFIMPTQFTNTPKSINEPAPTLTASRHHHYIVNPSHGGHTTSIDAPCPVIIARQDKAPLYLIDCESGEMSIPVYDCDTEVVIRIKQFMVIYHLVDIKMRMLRVLELLKIQGFPIGYKMVGNQTDQKKFIGNSVHPLVPKAWAEAFATKFNDILKAA